MLELLTSPYADHVACKRNPRLERSIRVNTDERVKAVDHIQALIRSVLGVKTNRWMSVALDSPGLEQQRFEVHLDSARSCGEMLLRVTAVDAVEVISPGELTAAWILEQQAHLYREGQYRAYAIRVKDGYELRRDAEMLVGGSDITHEADIVGLFQRFSVTTEEAGESPSLESILPELEEKRVNTYLTNNFHWSGTFLTKRHANLLELIFKFNEDRRRKHHIRVGYQRGCCYFEATIANEDRVKEFSRDKLLRCSWLRNRNVDLVGFLVRPDGCLVGRAFHPAHSMNFEEFIFTAYLLAVEADRMEYLINEYDEF